MPESCSFPKAARLRRRSEFLAIQRGGKRVHSPNFVVIAGGSTVDRPRLGTTVSSKVGNAVVRNRLKRYVREAFRVHLAAVLPPLDFVVIAKPGAADLGSQETTAELRKAFRIA